MLALYALLCGASAEATKVHGRVTAGGYIAREKFSETTAETDRNDVATLSGRTFLKVTEWGENRFEFVSDLRDKHDFFDKVDTERLELTDRNTLQARSLYLRYPGKNVFGTIGRLPVPDAGAAFTDGAEAGLKTTDGEIRGALFGGLNPKRWDQTFLQYNPDSSIMGTYLFYEPELADRDRFFYVSNALVIERVGSEVDRQYWFETLRYQWAPKSRIYLLSYLDSVPRVNLQNGTLQIDHPLTEKTMLTWNLLAVDVIEYSRRQGVRERLAPAPYREAGLKLKLEDTEDVSFEFRYQNGVRLADNLTRSEGAFAANISHIWGRRWDLYCVAGARKNFQSRDYFGRIGVGYYSREWEATFDSEVGSEAYDDGTDLHPLTNELNVARTIGKDLFMVLGVQDVRDEKVTITSAMFKITYRYGSEPVPPIRDGASPRGRL